MNKALRVVVGFLWAHWVLFTLLKLAQGGSAYGIGESTGKLVWVVIITFALTFAEPYTLLREKLRGVDGVLDDIIKNPPF